MTTLAAILRLSFGGAAFSGRRFSGVLSMACLLALLNLSVLAASLSVENLRCEYAENPTAIDLPNPRLYWQLTGKARSLRQTAYRVLAASSPELLAKNRGDLWDTGKITSEETIHIPYAGRAIESSEFVFWKVRVWDQDDRPSAWSKPAQWIMGVLTPEDWHASWISAKTNSPTLLLRREFQVRPHLRRALIHVCGLGQYELAINGRKVGEDLLSPGWTKYDRTCLYETRDITSFFHEGQNALGLWLGNGMYNVTGGRYTKFKGSFGPLKAIAQVRLEYDEGTVELLGTDDRWRTAAGPITFSCVYGGEDYDARLEPPGWTEPGFNELGWSPAGVTHGPGGKLRGHNCSAPPLRPFDTLTPVARKELRPGVTVFDLGQNASLMPRLTVHGPAGAALKITPSELVNPDGSLDRRSCGGGEAYWKYTLSGHGRESWFPKFFYHGCRYLQVEYLPGPSGSRPSLDSLVGVVVHTSSTPVGAFECSNDLFNRIHRLIRWAQRSNLQHVITDCPHRERLGWLEEYHLNGPSLRYEFDLAQLFAKGMNDMADSQLPNGLVPDIAPEYTVFSDGFRDSPEWGSAFVIVPWQQYEWTGDRGLLREHYSGMKRYVEFLAGRARTNLLSHGLGDWCDLGTNAPGYAQLTPIPLTATAFYYYDASILAKTAALLGYTNEAHQYSERTSQIRAAFNQAFFNPTTRQYATGSQCANSLALVMGLADPSQRTALLDAIVRDIRAHGNALTPGDVGYRYLLRALADGGLSDVIFDMNNQSARPGYGYQLEHGATSLAETWDARRDTSWNHFMLGHIVEWFYHDLAGIGPDPDGPGFKRVIIRPQPVGDITWARASYDSIRGRISSEWRIANGKFLSTITIPPNVTATVFVPTTSADKITESGTAPARTKGIRALRTEPHCAVYELLSGSYEFSAPIK